MAPFFDKRRRTVWGFPDVCQGAVACGREIRIAGDGGEEDEATNSGWSQSADALASAEFGPSNIASVDGLIG